jgi:hypothetical protein
LAPRHCKNISRVVVLTLIYVMQGLLNTCAVGADAIQRRNRLAGEGAAVPDGAIPTARDDPARQPDGDRLIVGATSMQVRTSQSSCLPGVQFRHDCIGAGRVPDGKDGREPHRTVPSPKCAMVWGMTEL